MCINIEIIFPTQKFRSHLVLLKGIYRKTDLRKEKKPTLIFNYRTLPDSHIKLLRHREFFILFILLHNSGGGKGGENPQQFESYILNSSQHK